MVRDVKNSKEGSYSRMREAEEKFNMFRDEMAEILENNRRLKQTAKISEKE